MSADDPKAIHEHINKEYLLVHKRTLSIFIALFAGLGLISIGSAYFAAKSAISTIAAASATRDVGKLSNEADKKVTHIQTKNEEASRNVTGVGKVEDTVVRSITVNVDSKATNGDRFHFFVVTDSDKVPFACLNNNPGGREAYPKLLFVLSGQHEGKQGIHVFGTLTAPATEGWCLTFGIMQQGMKGECLVIPIP